MFAGFQERTFVDHDALSARYRTLFDIDRLHVRAVHDTWGIADGLVVELVDGGSALEVSEGVGYDNAGTPLWLTETARLVPLDVGEYDVVLTEYGVVARVAAAVLDAGSLVLASVRAEAAGAQSLRWVDLRLRGRLVRRRHSAFLGAGSVDVNQVNERVVVSTSDARFRSIPLYFCDVVHINSAAVQKPPPASGLWTLAALSRAQAVGGPKHGPFFTICGATMNSFTVLFTRPIAPEHPSVRIIWVGVIPNRPVLDVGDPCQTYPIPDPVIG
jgi:hypothetical protein